MPIILYCYGSGLGKESVLLQYVKNLKSYFVIEYHSKSFGSEIKSYSPTELELLALDDSLDLFNSVLLQPRYLKSVRGFNH